MAAKPKTRAKRKSVVRQPATAAGAGVSITSLVPFLPPQYQSAGYIVATLFGLAVPILATMQQQRASD